MKGKDFRKTINGLAKESMAALGLVIVVFSFAVFTGGKSIQANNVQTILIQAMVTLVSAVGAIFVFATGQFDLSIGGIIGLCSAIAFLLGNNSAVMTITIGIIVGIITSSIVGFLIHYLRIPGLFVGIVMMSIGKCFVAMIATEKKMIVSREMLELNHPVFYFAVTIIVVGIGYVILNRTQAGLFMKSMGANPVATEFSGISIKKYGILAFMLTGCTCGIAAFMRMLRAGAVTATSGQGVELDVVLALIIGGIPVSGGMRTKIKNAVIGVLMINVLSNGFIMIGLPYSLVNLLKGVILLLACWISKDRTRRDDII